MFDSTSGKMLWQKQLSPNIEPGRSKSKVVLTETFCAILYKHIGNPEELPVPASGHSSGHISMLILDTSSGQEIYHQPCWKYCTGMYGTILQLPQVFFEGNYLIAYSRHDPFDAAPEINIVMCVKVDPASKTCKVRRTSTGLEKALHMGTLSKSNQEDRTVQQQVDNRNLLNFSFRLSSSKFLGFAHEGVAIIQLRLHFYVLATKFCAADVVLAVNLDVILDTYEPASIFSAVNVLSGRDVYSSFLKKLDSSTPDHVASDYDLPLYYYPHYETNHVGDVVLSGFVAVSRNDDDEDSLVPKLYSFKKRLEAKDLS